MVATMCKMFIVHIPHSEFYITIGKLLGFSWLAMAKKDNNFVHTQTQ